ncbi:nose resistant to fluoxetine protein 6 [Drosophila santomea]|uniref:nose resistant to fluoxetine protein 6 n=1 Tax=Drosophila santomea TaxID=129105 RepID=UPI001952C29F|nr:nose resistant to fluoxetine protein 6 [Drosophila santomea]XP_039483884.1 nose resistant to fluoxetine protein 6 [Drosophila santomea]
MTNKVLVFLLCGIVFISAGNPSDEDVLPEFRKVRNLRSLGIEFAEYFRNISLEDLGVSQLVGVEDLLCLNDMARLMAGLRSAEYWALKMIDAWGSIPSGLLTGHSYDLGNFDECLNIRKEVGQGRSIQGKYCFLSVSPAKIMGIETSLGSFKTATCFPASCSAAHMNTFVGQLMGKLLNVSDPSSGMSISEGSCQASESGSWDGLTIFMIVMFSVMSCIVALFTLWDYFLVKDQNRLPSIVKIFSARANSRALFRVVESHSNPNVIDCLHGIRCLSLIWVITCHQYSASLISPHINLFSAATWVESPFASFILHGFIAVDSFLVIGGLLVALIPLRLMDKTKGKLNVPMMYLHRLIRIAPLLAMAIVVHMKLMPLISDGPLFVGGYLGNAACRSGWYWTLLFVNNYTDAKCLGQSWYLSMDMQLYIISPIFLISLYKWGKKAAAGIFILILSLAACLFATMMVNGYSMMVTNATPGATEAAYYATHTHATPWLIGFLFGYFLHLSKGKKFQLSWVSVWSGWILCLAMIFTSLFAMYPPSKWSDPSASTLAETSYYTFTRLGWAMALCWVIFACVQGHGGLANSFLSSPLWQPLSRLSYSVFIWHMFFMEMNARSTRTSTYFSDYQMMLNIWSTFGFTVLFSYAMHLLIEAPFGGLDIFLRPKAKSPPIEKQTSPRDDKEPSAPEEPVEPPTSTVDKLNNSV